MNKQIKFYHPKKLLFGKVLFPFLKEKAAMHGANICVFYKKFLGKCYLIDYKELGAEKITCPCDRCQVANTVRNEWVKENQSEKNQEQADLRTFNEKYYSDGFMKTVDSIGGILEEISDAKIYTDADVCLFFGFKELEDRDMPGTIHIHGNPEQITRVLLYAMENYPELLPAVQQAMSKALLNNLKNRLGF